MSSETAIHRTRVWTYLLAAILVAVIAVVAVPAMQLWGNADSGSYEPQVTRIEFEEGPTIDGQNHGSFRLERAGQWVTADIPYWDTEANTRTDAGELVHYLLGSRFKRTQAQYHQRDWQRMTIDLSGVPHAAHYYDRGVKAFYNLTSTEREALQGWMNAIWRDYQPYHFLPGPGEVLPGIETWRSGTRELLDPTNGELPWQLRPGYSRFTIVDGHGRQLIMEGLHTDPDGGPWNIMGYISWRFADRWAPINVSGCEREEFDRQTFSIDPDRDGDGQRPLTVTNHYNPSEGSDCPASIVFRMSADDTSELIYALQSGFGHNADEVKVTFGPWDATPAEPILLEIENPSSSWQRNSLWLSADITVVERFATMPLPFDTLKVDMWAYPKAPNEFGCDSIPVTRQTVVAQGKGHNQYELHARLYPDDLRAMGIDPNASSAERYCWNFLIHNTSVDGGAELEVDPAPSGVKNVQWNYSQGEFNVSWEYFGFPDGQMMSLTDKTDQQQVFSHTNNTDTTQSTDTVCLREGNEYVLDVVGWINHDGSPQQIGPRYTATISGSQSDCASENTPADPS